MNDPMHDVQRTLGEIVGELRGIRADFSQHFEDDKKNFGDIDKELSGLQKKIWFGSGFGAALGSLMTFWLKGHW